VDLFLPKEWEPCESNNGTNVMKHERLLLQLLMMSGVLRLKWNLRCFKLAVKGRTRSVSCWENICWRAIKCWELPVHLVMWDTVHCFTVF